ncbi:MAG: hypothetical protein SPL78_03900 [Bacteroidales bacterium]|nr:hypothetical protein [Bacteroidales bacterium]
MPSKAPGEPSAAIRERVIKARAIQSLRFKNHPGVHCNAQMTPSLLHQYAEPDAEGMAQLRQAITSMKMKPLLAGLPALTSSLVLPTWDEWLTFHFYNKHKYPPRSFAQVLGG